MKKKLSIALLLSFFVFFSPRISISKESMAALVSLYISHDYDLVKKTDGIGEEHF